MATPPVGATGATPPAGAAAGGINTTTRTVVVNGVPQTFTATLAAGMVRPKTVTTDAQGVFEFSGLPPGSYRVSASPGQYSGAYLTMSYGAKRPASPSSPEPGTPIEIADGQVFDKATVGLPRGAVITGRVTDENGDPLARVQVFTVMFQPGSSRGMRMGGGQTDDLGQFRVFGLAPGDYVVGAEARGNNFVPANAPAETEEDKLGFMTTYYPGTADEAAAQRVRARATGESGGVDIRLVTGRLFHLTGMVTDSQGRASARASGTLFRRTSSSNLGSTFGFSTDEQGRFRMRNIPPGNYRLSVRQQLPPGARVTEGSSGDQTEFAWMPITIMADMDDVLVTTSPGATITGTVVFENGPPQLQANQPPPQMRVLAMQGDPEAAMGAPSSPTAVVAPDLTFTLNGLAGEMLLRTAMVNNSLKAVMVGSDDVTDTPHEFKTGERVTIVLTSRASTLEGNVTDAVGKPTADAFVALFSDDKTYWRTSSIRTKRSTVDQAGHYRLTGLPPGRYYLVALPRDRMGAFSPQADASVFEALSKEATTVVVGEDETRQVDVKVSGGGP